jgi:hypothetical protein
MKNLFLIVVCLIAVVCCAFAIRVAKRTQTAEDQLNMERYKRMTAEEELEKTRTAIEKMKGDLATAIKRAEDYKLISDQEKIITKEFQRQVEALNIKKAALESQLNQVPSQVP